MMTVTVKMRRQRLFVIGTFFLIILLMAVAAMLGKQDDHSLVVQNSITQNTNDERIRFLSELGWQVSDEPCTISDVLIPGEFDDVYNNYNEIQLGCGYDLRSYKSKLVKKYTYEVLNYPNAAKGETVYVNLLIYQNEIIGGDVSSAQLNGFMHGLNMP